MAEVQGTTGSTITPVILSYKYKGNCLTCGTNVDTLEQDVTIDNKDYHFVLAYCMNCKLQIKSRKVDKLEKE